MPIPPDYSAYTIGSTDGPYILIVSTASLRNTSQLLAEARAIVKNPDTFWHNLARGSYPLRKEIQAILSLDELAGRSAFLAVDPANITTGYDNSEQYILLTYPEALPLDAALAEIDRWGPDALPYSIAAAVIAADRAFQNGRTAVAQIPAYYAQVADVDLSGPFPDGARPVEELIEAFLTDREKAPVALDNYLPEDPIVRARFLEALSAKLWEPSVRQRLCQRHDPDTDQSLGFLAGAWLSLQPVPTIEIAGATLPVFHGGYSFYTAWYQTMEWERGQITRQALDFVGPPSGIITERDQIEITRPISKGLRSFSRVLIRQLSASAAQPGKEPFDKALRLTLPDPAVQITNRHRRLSLWFTGAQSAWVGLETAGQSGFSLAWSVAPWLSPRWAAQFLLPEGLVYWHFLLTCLWHDLCVGTENEFPLAHPPTGRRYWGTRAGQAEAVRWAQRVNQEVAAVLRREERTETIARRLIEDLQADPILQTHVGLTCLTLWELLIHQQ